MRKLFAIIACIALGSCATPPKQSSFSNKQTFSLTKDQAWEKIIDYFTSNNIQIKTIEKDSGVIYAERSLSEKSMSNCGEDPLSVELSRPATLNVFVRSFASGTEVTVNAEFKVVRTFNNQTWTNACYSTGVLERDILTKIGS